MSTKTVHIILSVVYYTDETLVKALEVAVKVIVPISTDPLVKNFNSFFELVFVLETLSLIKVAQEKFNLTCLLHHLLKPMTLEILYKGPQLVK